MNQSVHQEQKNEKKKKKHWMNNVDSIHDILYYPKANT